MRHFADILDTLVAISTERVLRAIRVVEVDVLAVLPSVPGVVVQLVQRLLRQTLEDIVVSLLLPRVIIQDLCRLG